MTEIRIGQLDLRDLSTSNLGSANAVANLESNIVSVATTVNSAIDTVSANADTLTTLLNTVSGNIDAAASLVSTVSGNADTLASLVTSFASYGNTNYATGTYIDDEVADIIASAPAALDTLQELATAINNDANFFDTITGLADTVNDNTAGIETSIDGIQANLDSYATYANSQFGAASNISLTVGSTSISNTTIFLEGARSSITLDTNTSAKSITFNHAMGNATSQEFTMNGSVNTLSLTSTATSNTNMYFVFYNGLALKPDEYTVSGSTMTLNNVEPIISGSNVEVRYLDFFGFRETAAPATPSGAWYQGSNFGYVSGGSSPVTPAGHDQIDKISFTSDGSSSDIGELDTGLYGAAGVSSETNGYVVGGRSGPSDLNDIQKFPFASDTGSTDIAQLSAVARYAAGFASETHGYATVDSPAAGYVDKFSFSSDSNGSSIGSTPVTNVNWRGGHNSTEYGYVTFLLGAPAYYDSRRRFSLSSDSDGVSLVNSPSPARNDQFATTSAETYAYIVGGSTPSGGYGITDIQKFPFASDTDARSDAGTLTQGMYGASGSTSTTKGYISGGGDSSYVRQTTIQTFPYSSDTTSTDIGEISAARSIAAGAQY